MQHIVSWDDKSELIIGQLHNIQGRQLFLMAFHQSHTSFSVANAPDEPHIEQLVGECRVMRQLKRLISRIAPSHPALWWLVKAARVKKSSPEQSIS